VSHATQSVICWQMVDPGHSPAANAQSLPREDPSADCRTLFGSASMQPLPEIVQPHVIPFRFIAMHAEHVVAERQPFCRASVRLSERASVPALPSIGFAAFEQLESAAIMATSSIALRIVSI
jgi:hypothetical protein